MNEEYINTLYGNGDTSTETPAVTENTNPSQTGIETTGTNHIGDFYQDKDKPVEQGNPYAVNKGSTEDVLYGNANSVELSDSTDLNIIYSDPTQQQNLKDNLGHMAGELGVDQQGVESFVNITNDFILSGEKPDAQSTMQQLYQEHGQELHVKLQEAQTLIKSLPDLSTYLDETGLGNCPKFINKVLNVCKSPRAAERLKQLTMRGKK